MERSIEIIKQQGAVQAISPLPRTLFVNWADKDMKEEPIRFCQISSELLNTKMPPYLLVLMQVACIEFFLPLRWHTFS